MPRPHPDTGLPGAAGESLDLALENLTPGRRTPSVVLSYGLGVDSTAILLRWITEPDSRDFDLDDLVIVTAMTGDEWTQTGVDVETHILPLLRAHRIRYVQVARGRRHVTAAGDGVVVLDDSTTPTRVHLSGAYRLSDELWEAGTVAQVSGARLCSVHAKGDALDPVIARITGGRPYRHVVGFEANEPGRALKDAGYNTVTRTGVYPLIEWGWDRAACEDYITKVTGITWNKSACWMCPFALANAAGRARTLARYAADPAAGAATLMLEHVALALNPTQGILGATRVIDLVRDAGHNHVLARFRADLAGREHALYEVRRILRPRKTDPTKVANSARSVRTLATGTREEMLAALTAEAVEIGDDQIARAYLRRRGASLPTSEHFLVAAPSGVLDKEREQFAGWWADLHPETQPQRQLALL